MAKNSANPQGFDPTTIQPQEEITTPQKPIQFTSRNPPWTYLKLQLYALIVPSIYINTNQLYPRINQPNTTTDLDALTARTFLTSALSQFLGLAGTAIPIDILKVFSEASPQNQNNVWIRVPREDASAVVAALSSWIGGSKGNGGGNVAWRICAKGNFLGALVAGSGADLFVPSWMGFCYNLMTRGYNVLVVALATEPFCQVVLRTGLEYELDTRLTGWIASVEHESRISQKRARSSPQRAAPGSWCYSWGLISYLPVAQLSDISSITLGELDSLSPYSFMQAECI